MPFLAVLAMPVLAVTLAFFLLPLVRLTVIAGSGVDGLSAYTAVITTPRYLESLFATTVLSAAVTVVTLAISAVAGVFLERNRFAGRNVLISLLTFPLAFPGVVIGFMVIMLAGRQGLIGEITKFLTGDKLVFAYSMAGLFVGYVYFSIPRVILTIMAAAEKTEPAPGRGCSFVRRFALASDPRCHSPRLEACIHRIRRNSICDGNGSLWHSVYSGDQHRCVTDGYLY